MSTGFNKVSGVNGMLDPHFILLCHACDLSTALSLKVGSLGHQQPASPGTAQKFRIIGICIPVGEALLLYHFTSKYSSRPTRISPVTRKSLPGVAFSILNIFPSNKVISHVNCSKDLLLCYFYLINQKSSFLKLLRKYSVPVFLSGKHFQITVIKT